LMSSRASHPATTRLMHIALHVGEFQAMRYKRLPAPGNPIANRPRPSQLSPALMPPIAVPGHASYPSGHSTQSHLLSGLLARAMPPAVTTPLPVLPGAPVPAVTGAPPPPSTAPFPPVLGGGPPSVVPPPAAWDSSLLGRLAERVSRNREVLGLHYPSDSYCGAIIAKASLDLLLQCPTVATLVVQAQGEWL